MNSIRKPALIEIVKALPAVANEWTFDPRDILNSPRKVRGKFHTPKIDKDNEYIEKTAVQTAVPDFMHLPILHDFHKERTVGIVTRVVELSDGSFDFEGLIKATDDCNDIWELIAKGEYNQVSIYGKRTCGTAACSVRPEQRMEPCVTTGVRLDSISVCDENARNDGTSLMVAKGSKVVFNATEELIKAETTDSSLMHTVTDYPRKFGSDGLPRTKKKCTATCPQYERNDLGKGDVMDVTAESAEGKLDTLISLVEKLVQKDITEKGTPYDNNYSDKSPDVGSAPESADQGRELPPEESREYGAPEEEKAGNYGLAQNRAASKLDMDAVARQGQTRAADPDVDITHYASKYHLKKEAEREKGKEGFVQNEAPLKQQPGQGVGEVPGEEKARPGDLSSDNPKKKYPALKEESVTAPIPNPDEKRPDWQLDQVAERRADKEAMVEQQVGQDSERPKKDTSGNAQKPTTPPWSKQEHSSQSQTPTEDSKKNVESVAPSGAKEFSGIPYKGKGDAKQSQFAEGKTPTHHRSEGTPAPKPGKQGPDEPEPSGAKRREQQSGIRYKPGNEKPFEPKTEVGQRFKGEVESMGFDKKQGEEVRTQPKPTAEGAKREETSGDTRTDYVEQSDGPVDVERSQILNEGEDKNEMPDIDSRIDRLIQVISQLVQSDEQVHERMGEEKAVHNDPAKQYNIDDKTGKPYETSGVAIGADAVRWKNAQGSDIYGKKDYSTRSERKQASEMDRKFGQVREGAENSDASQHSMRRYKSEVPRDSSMFSKGTDEMKDEEVDTLVKAKVAAEVEAISKAYQVQVDELKARLDKMEKETIEKSGVVVVMREGDESVGTPYLTNAAAVAAAKKSKVT